MLFDLFMLTVIIYFWIAIVPAVADIVTYKFKPVVKHLRNGYVAELKAMIYRATLERSSLDPAKIAAFLVRVDAAGDDTRELSRILSLMKPAQGEPKMEKTG